MTRKPKSESLDADLAASVTRGLSDIENGRYHPFDAEKIRARATAELETEIRASIKSAEEDIAAGRFTPLGSREDFIAELKARNLASKKKG